MTDAAAFARRMGPDASRTSPTPETVSTPSAVRAVQVEGLCFSYDNGEETLSDVSLSVEPGDFLAVIGPNGGGKSTLLRLLLGLSRPSRGSVRIFGKHPSSMSRHIGYVPQFSTLQLDFPASVLEMTLMGGACPDAWGGRWRTDRTVRDKALAYLDILGLAQCAHLPIRALSGGQRQRALVARALMGRPDASCDPTPAKSASKTDGTPSTNAGNRPDAMHALLSGESFLLLLDEPTASIDPEGKFCFYEFIGKLRGSVTMIVVSHDMFMASPFFTHIAFVNRTVTPLLGKTLTPDTVTALFGNHMHECPLADLQHAGGVLHEVGCSHPTCRSTDVACKKDAGCSVCGETDSSHRGRAGKMTV